MKTRCENWVTAPSGGDAEQLSLIFQLTKDNRFAARAKNLLLALVNKPYWDGMDDRVPRWNSGLATSHNNWIAAVTFDAIYEYLTPIERKNIAEKIIKLGINPSVNDWLSKDKRIQSLNNMGHNWWSAIVFEAGIASLAVMNDVPRGRQWSQEIMEASDEWIAFTGSLLENKPANFDPAGGFYESVNYANYGVSEYLLFRLAYSNAIGKISKPYDGLLQKTVEWFMHAAYPTTKGLMSLNFGDGHDFANGDRPAKLMVALGLGKSDFNWYIRQTSKTEYKEDMGIRSPMGLLYEPERSNAPLIPTLNPSAIYSSMGWGMLRDSWTPDGTFLGLKSGFTWNHAHADAGSFVLYHKGQNLLIDGGDVGYGNPEYSNYFVTSKAHNVTLFNGVAQDPQDQYYAVKNSGSLHYLLDAGNLKYILADATGPTSRYFLRNYRNFLWIGDVILIIDDLKTYESGKFEFLLHYSDTALKRGPDLEISKGNAGILFRPLYPEMLPTGYPHDFPEKMKYRTEYGLKDHTTNVKIPYYVISPPEQADRIKLVNAIILLDDNNKTIKTFTGSSGANAGPGRSDIPLIERFSGVNYLGIRITQHGQVTDIYINLLADGRLMHRNSSITVDGWETDAYLTALTFPLNARDKEPEQMTSFFLGNGSYLRKNGLVKFSSLSKLFLSVTKETDVLDVKVTGQPLINASVGFKNVRQLRLNGKMQQLSKTPGQLINFNISAKQ